MENYQTPNEDSFSFWKNLVLVTIFFVITPIALGVSIFSLFSLNKTEISKNQALATPNLLEVPRSGARVFASLPSSFPSVSGEAEVSDARPEIVRQFLEAYKSPLEPLADYIVEIADQYKLDYRLTTAIAMKESGLCKVIPPDTYNCWGWGIHSEGTLGFDSYAEGIETVSRGLKENYIDLGYETTEEIMSKYTPLSNGSWAEGVNYYMNQMVE